MYDIAAPKIGVLGGGQLGRMMIQSAIDFNLNISVLDPDPNAPCKNLVQDFQNGELTDYETVYAFGQSCDLITIEIEKVNTDALKALQSEGKRVFPQPEVIELIQDKRKQKVFYKANRIPTADFVLTENAQEVATHTNFLPAVNKLGKGGYDGKGVQIIHRPGDFEKAFDAPGILERLVPFEKELSVVVAKNEQGEVRTFPVVECSYHPTENLVEFLFSPAEIKPEIEEKARKLAEDVIDKMGMIGLLAVEMFLTKDGEVLVNEAAPRTHNSGHQTIEGNVTSQFEQHIRAIMDLPLGSTELTRPSAMVNLLGETGYTGHALYQGLDEVMRMADVHIHLYGKKETKPFRKMGHVTLGDQSVTALKQKAQQVKGTLKVIA